MDDLNSLALYAAVVTHGSFSAAARALAIPKSRLSRRISDLEEQLGVRLLQRSTRAIHVTEVGRTFYAHCQEMVQAGRAAIEVAERAVARPAGRLRVSCPMGVSHLFLAPLLPDFLRAYPDVRLELELTNRRVDVIGEGYDVAIRVRTDLEDSELAVRMLCTSDQVVVASPDFLARHGPFESLESMRYIPGAGPAGIRGDRPCWHLMDADGTYVEVPYTPVFAHDDVHLLAQIALGGVCAVQIPFTLCALDLQDGRLHMLQPHHRPRAHQLHAVFPSRRGLVPAVRAFIDHIAGGLQQPLAGANKIFKDLVALTPVDTTSPG